MANLFSTPADVVNGALVRLGRKNRIGSLYDGSRAAKAALDIFGQTRDELLRTRDWGFAGHTAALDDPLKTAPVGGYGATVWSDTYPPLPWIYEYAYPDDCVKVRALKQTPGLIPAFDPRPRVFSIADDVIEEVSQRVILTNVYQAICVYTRQVTDPLQWDVLFTEAMCAALARRLAPVLANLDAAKLEAQDEAFETNLAGMKQG